jgi:hypothetical protein
MIRKSASFFLSAILFLFACQRVDTFTEAEKAAVKSSVRQMLDDYYDAIRTGGLMAEFAYLDSSTEFFWAPPGYTSWISYDSVAAVIKRNAAAFSSVDNVWDTLRVDPLTSEYATYSGTLHATMIDTAGQVTKLSMIETGVVVRRKDGWKLLRGQTTLLPE